MFQLTDDEHNSLRSQFVTLETKKSLRSQIVTSNQRDGRRCLPYAFTEQGVAMLSAVLRSETAVEIKEFKNSHDRFIVIDGNTVYHFGASLKDIGKKWFAFSKMDIGAAEMLTNLKKVKLV